MHCVPSPLSFKNDQLTYAACLASATINDDTATQLEVSIISSYLGTLRSFQLLNFPNPLKIDPRQLKYE
jgi:hypothetical protein